MIFLNNIAVENPFFLSLVHPNFSIFFHQNEMKWDEVELATKSPFMSQINWIEIHPLLLSFFLSNQNFSIDLNSNDHFFQKSFQLGLFKSVFVWVVRLVF